MPAGGGIDRADQHIGVAIAVHIAGRGHGISGEVAPRHAIEAKAIAAIQRAEIEAGCPATGLPEDHIAGPGIGAPAGVGVAGADDQVGIAIPVHIAGRGDGAAAAVTGRHAIKTKAGAAIQRAEIEAGRPAAGLAEDHIAGPGTAVSAWVGGIGADDQVGIAIAIHIAGRSHGISAGVVIRCAIEAKAGAAIQRAEIEGGRPAAGLAEDHIAGSGTEVPAGVGAVGANDQVGIAIPVHIAGRGDGAAAEIAYRRTVEAKAVAAIQRAEGETAGPAGGLAEDHIAGSGTAAPASAGSVGADDQVGIAIAIHIASRGNGRKTCPRHAGPIGAVEQREIEGGREWHDRRSRPRRRVAHGGTTVAKA